MSFGLEQEGGSLIAPMALAHPLHPIDNRSRNRRRNLGVGWCVSSWWPLFLSRSFVLIYMYIYAFSIWVLFSQPSPSSNTNPIHRWTQFWPLYMLVPSWAPWNPMPWRSAVMSLWFLLFGIPMHLDIYKGTYIREWNWRTIWSKSRKYLIDLILKIPRGRGCRITWKLLIRIDIICTECWIRNSTQMNWSSPESLLMISVSTQPYVIGELFPWRYSRDICDFCLNFTRLWFLSNRFLILTMAGWTDCFVNW